jgi:hypothetical protein
MRDLGDDPSAFDEMACLCVATVTTAVSYLECRVNEFYSDIFNRGADGRTLSEEQRRAFNRIGNAFDWKRQASILEKYQLALAALGLDPFDAGSAPYQDAAILVQLRNEFVHSEPRSTEVRLPSGERMSAPKLESRLRDKIGECPSPTLKPFFPENCLHLRCGEWAVTSSQVLVDAFLTKVGAKLTPYVASAWIE